MTLELHIGWVWVGDLFTELLAVPESIGIYIYIIYQVYIYILYVCVYNIPVYIYF